MPITKEQKKKVVEDLSNILNTSKSVVFLNFKGLNVADTSAMRRSLRGNGIGYGVIKKTLVHRALDEKNMEGERPGFAGELALAYGEDLLAPAREVYKYQKKYDGKIKIVGGIFEGAYKSADGMLEIALIPPVDVLRGMFVNVINSPIQRFAIALGEIVKLKK